MLAQPISIAMYFCLPVLIGVQHSIHFWKLSY